MLQIREYKVDDLAKVKDPDTEVPADQTITFAVNGAEYKIDLTDKNAEAFLKKVAPYQQAAQKVRSVRASRRRPSVARQKSANIRDWARKHGIAVNDRGRIPVDVIAEYEAAHPLAA